MMIWINIRTIFGFAIISMTMACQKEPDGMPFTGPDNHNRSIKVAVHHVFDSIVFTDSLVPDTEVRLYSDRDQFITDGYYDAIQYSDSSGVALFEFRDEDYYWIRCYHPAHGFTSDSVNTPPQTISFVEIFYYF